MGQEVVTYTYDAWGNLLSDTDNSGIGAATLNPFIYKGYWYDWDTGLYYLNARYYNPTIGRFLSEDPVGGVNKYAYTGNNPVNKVDPSGTASYNVYSYSRFGIKIENPSQNSFGNFVQQAGDFLASLPPIDYGANYAGDALEWLGVVLKGADRVAEGTGKVLWGSWNDYEHVEVDGQTYAKVGDRLYSKHAVDRMQPSWNRF